jgi:HAD superfamily hydrolase (TIGR01662 family)
MTAIRAVVFDVGETLIYETASWCAWADWLGVPRFTFLAALGGVIASGLDHRDVFEWVRPGIDIDAERRARLAAGRHHVMTEADFYADALPSMRSLAQGGFSVGIAANQPETTEAVLHKLAVPIDLVASSERWGVSKPDPAFFDRICQELRISAGEIAYVGDRLDNDIAPAAAAGMTAIFLRRGPWAIIQSAAVDPAAVGAAAVIASLTDLPGVLNHLSSEEPEQRPGVG